MTKEEKLKITLLRLDGKQEDLYIDPKDFFINTNKSEMEQLEKMYIKAKHKK